MKFYEHHTEPLISFVHFLRRESAHIAIAAILLVAAIGIGILGFMTFCGFDADDAMVDSAMLLSGMGPVNCSTKPLGLAGKVFASGYALLCGIVFFTAMGIVLAPVLHRMLHVFHRTKNDSSL